jgi:hypothetical protein
MDARDHVEQRRLPRPVGADEGNDLPGSDMKRDMPEDLDLPEKRVDVFNF